MPTTTYIISFKDEHGTWFYVAPHRWSDSSDDAYRFADKVIASNEAFSAEARLNRTWRSAPTYSQPEKARATCRVIPMRPTA